MLPLLPESYYEKFDPKILLALRQTDKMTHRLATQALFHQRNELAVTYQKNFLSKAIHSSNIEIDTNLILTCIKNPSFGIDDRWHGMFIIAAKNKLVLSSNIKAIETRFKDKAIKKKEIKFLDKLKQIEIVFDTVLKRLNDDSINMRYKSIHILEKIAPWLTPEQIESVFDILLKKLIDGNVNGESVRIFLCSIHHRLTQEQIKIVFDTALNKLIDGNVNGESFPILSVIAPRLTQAEIAPIFHQAMSKLYDKDSLQLRHTLRAMCSRLTLEQIDMVYDKALNKLNDNSESEHNESFEILTVIASRLTQKQMETVYDKALNKLKHALGKVHGPFGFLTAIAPQLTQIQIAPVIDEAISKLYDDERYELLGKVLAVIGPQLTQKQVDIVFDKALNKLNAGLKIVYFTSLQILKIIVPRLAQKQIISVLKRALTMVDDRDRNGSEAVYLFSYIIVLGKWDCSELNKINVQNSPNGISIYLQHFAELFHQIASPNSNKRKECSPKLDIGFFSAQPSQKKIKLENNLQKNNLENNVLQAPTLS